MIRFLSFLFNKPYETCKSCATYKEQLDFERSENKELRSTLLNLIKPKVFEQPAQELKPLGVAAQPWTKKRAILEQQARDKAKILTHSPLVAKTDDVNKKIEELEQELDISDNSEEKENNG